MTREEAVTKLTNVMNDDIYSWSPSILTAFNMAVDALRGADGDCISRQATIYALTHEWDGMVTSVFDLIKALPSVQSNATEHSQRVESVESVGDTISRQAAIDAFDCTDELIVSGSANAQNVMNYINKVIGKIKALPPAQTELEDKILAIGYTGEEGHIYIGGRLFAVRELAQ